MSQIVELNVGSVSAKLIGGDKYPSGWFPSADINDADRASLSNIIRDNLSKNFATVMPVSDWSLARGFAWGKTVVEVIHDPVQPDDLLFTWKERAKNPDFYKRRAAGEIIVSPYSVGKITYQFKVSTEQDNGDYSKPVGDYGNYFLASTKDKETAVRPYIPGIPRMYFHPQGGDAAMVNYSTTYYRQRMHVGAHPLNLGFSPPFKDFKSFGVPFSEKCILGAYESSLSGTYDALTELAELPETVRMFIDLIRDAAEAAQKCRNREVEIRKLATKKAWTALRLSKALADLWLQYRYALKPIAYSIEDLGRTLLEYKRIFARFRDKVEGQVELPEIPNWATSSTGLNYTIRCMIKNQYTAEGLVDSLLDVIKLNPFSTAWELVPLSFVIDWFVNIGQLITVWSSPDYSIQSKATYSVKIEGTVVFTHTQSNARVNCTVNVYDRIVINNPGDYANLLLNIDLTLKQKVDGIALLWGPIHEKLSGLKYFSPHKRKR